jgi:lipopolysaccharide export system protein LptC
MTRDTNARSAVAEPLAPLPKRGGRTGREWTPRMRGTALDALRYTRFVAIMKRTLPIIAGMLVAAVLAYSFIPRSPDRVTMTYDYLGKIDNDLAMMKPRLTGSDAKGNPFVITADVAVQDRRNTRRARLKNVQADMTLDQQRWISATATTGLFDMNASTLALAGGISVYSDSGYEMHTGIGNIDIKRGVFHGPGEVHGQGPLGTFRADRFQIDRATRQMLLIGNVHMTMYVQDSKTKKGGK